MIVYPLRGKMKKKTTLTIAAGIWIVSCILAFPMILVFTTQKDEEGRVACMAVFPDGQTTESYMENV